MDAHTYKGDYHFLDNRPYKIFLPATTHDLL